MDIITIKNGHSYFLILIGSIIILYLSPLAPFANKITGYDSSVFVYCAQHILDGKIMYKDIFDHKGPLLYAFNVLGIALCGGNVTGIWFMELFFAFVTFAFIYKSICLFFSKGIALISTLSCLVFLSVVYCQGNLAEEYTLPFISLSMYYFLRFFQEQKIRWSHFLIISVCFGCILLIKPNAAVSCLVGWAIVAALLLIKKKGIDLLKITLISLGGLILSLIPLCVYLFVTDSFADFKFCYFEFNGAYSDISFRIISRVIRRILFFPTFIVNVTSIFISLSALLFVFSYKSYKNKLPLLFYFAALAATFVAIAVSETNFYHYYLILTPVLSFSYAMVYDAIKKHIHSHSIIVFSLLFFILNTVAMSSYYPKLKLCFRKKQLITDIVSFIDNHSKKEDKIYIIGNACLFYNVSHRESASKYPFLAPVVDIKGYREKVIDRFFKDMEATPPRVILYDMNWMGDIDWIVHEDIPGLNDFLKANYIKTQSFENFDCYIKNKE
jgi:hypothetical protein